MKKLSPMMKQYFEIKKSQKDNILFFRLGDFYEMFFDDAVLASKILNIALTGRDCGLEEKAPMCGVPFHSADQYIEKLIAAGHNVAVCEQVEEADASKGIVRRSVVKVITPGTMMSGNVLLDKNNNFLASVCEIGESIGFACVDISTGELSTTEFSAAMGQIKIIDEVSRYSPSEILLDSSLRNDEKFISELKDRFNIKISAVNDLCYDLEYAKVKCKIQFKDISNIEDKTCCCIAVGSLLEYLSQTQMRSLPHIGEVKFYQNSEFLSIDYSTKRNLELCSTVKFGSKKGSLLGVLDKTCTPMGGRMMRSWLDKPLVNLDSITTRHKMVNVFFENLMFRNSLRNILSEFQDIERLVSRAVTYSINPRDVYTLALTLKKLPSVFSCMKPFEYTALNRYIDGFDDLSDISDFLLNALKEEPPVSVRDGGIISDGFNDVLDNYRLALSEGLNWIASLESDEKKSTGIKNLKVGFNRVTGYYIEVSKSNLENVPISYIRKQTLSNCERYTTEKLKSIESEILNAQERSFRLEFELFNNLIEYISRNSGRILKVCSTISNVDVLCTIAEVSVQNKYVMPKMIENGVISIKRGRHPVVERSIDFSGFVPNDTYLDTDGDLISIITGPNMSGKSTYMRQVALIVIMAQMGFFVPADSAEIGIVDKIFSRIGASDDLNSGKSTFMVEMCEVSNILKNATNDSLIILDEVGRGTSTYDGLSIAWAVVEYISCNPLLRSKTLFATHYHELIELGNQFPCIKNYNVSVKRDGSDVIFLHTIEPGGAEESYGIAVARLAGVPSEVTSRAEDILQSIHDKNGVGAAR